LDDLVSKKLQQRSNSLQPRQQASFKYGGLRNQKAQQGVLYSTVVDQSLQFSPGVSRNSAYAKYITTEPESIPKSTFVAKRNNTRCQSMTASRRNDRQRFVGSEEELASFPASPVIAAAQKPNKYRT
jgi:hypothetical protein